MFALQQLVEIVHCRYRRPDPGIVFTFGFTVALLVSNYAEARLVVNRELYWILMVALPLSMLRQITLPRDAAVGPRRAASGHRLSPDTRAALAGRRRASIARTAIKARLAARLDARPDARPDALPAPPLPSPPGDPSPERSP